MEIREITVTRTFPDFSDFWATTATGASLISILGSMPGADLERVKARVRARLSPDRSGQISYAGRANAIKGSR